MLVIGVPGQQLLEYPGFDIHKLLFACLDLGFPMRYSHSALEVVDPADLDGLARLIDLMLDRITPDLRLTR